jgi:signal-transduction protein with cAMP-binding, CBS, and nucleotidyltransferase domain
MSKVRNLIKDKSVKCLNQNASVYEAANIMSANKISCVVVKDKDKLVGIFTDRDLKNRVIVQELDYKDTKLSKVMTKSVETIGMEDDVEDCLISMSNQSCHHLPVVHENKVVAVLSKQLVMKWVLKNITSERNALMQYIYGTFKED